MCCCHFPHLFSIFAFRWLAPCLVFHCFFPVSLTIWVCAFYLRLFPFLFLLYVYVKSTINVLKSTNLFKNLSQLFCFNLVFHLYAYCVELFCFVLCVSLFDLFFSCYQSDDKKCLLEKTEHSSSSCCSSSSSGRGSGTNRHLPLILCTTVIQLCIW